MSQQPPILLIEDDDIDQKIVARAFQNIECRHALKIAEDGEEAIDVLFSNNFNPLFILLDLDLPKVNGFEVLEKLHRSGKLQSIPVVIMTRSRFDEQRLSPYKKSLAGFVRKRMNYPSFAEDIQDIYNKLSLPSYIRVFQTWGIEHIT